MKAQRIELFKLNGKEYRTIKGLQAEAVDEIGRKVIDTIPVNIPPKIALAIVDHITKNKEAREALTTWLNVTIETDIGEYYAEYEDINIFDL